MVILIVFGMVIFALSHSLFAEKSFKQAVRKRFGERVYYGFFRLSYNIFAALLLAPILLITYFGSRAVIWSFPNELEIVLLSIQAVGLIGLVVSLLQTNLGQFTGLSQVRAYVAGDPLPLPIEPLQTKGMYALVRHPLYLFSLMILWPVSSMTDTMLAFNIAATLYFVIGSRYEERRLTEAFGQPYRAYQQRVAWLIPFVKLRR